MKYERYELEYNGHLSNIQLGVDDTDHITFFCPKCYNPLEVIRCFTRNINLNLSTLKDNCTWIKLVCHECKSIGQRKFYWTKEDGKFCWQRTFDNRE